MACTSIYGTSLIAISWLCSGTAAAQTNPPKSLADASMEELMNIEVTSVSKKPQRLASTAASVYVITAEDIRRSGITVLPELLRLAPGVQVARLSSGSWAIGIRGFNDEFSNKLLVLVDGRSVYNEFYAGTFWDTLNISVEDLERIEVIRGPGAAMWGTNAVNGVINIISKSAKTTKGFAISGGGGSTENSDAALRYGGETGGASYRLGAQNTEESSLRLTNLDHYSLIPSHGWANRNADFRLDWDLSPSDSLLVSGGMYKTSVGELVPATTITAPNAPPTDDRISTSGGNLVARWQHVFSETSSIQVRFSFDRMFRNDPQTSGDIRTFDYGFQHHLAVGSRNDLIWGFSLRNDSFESNPGAVLRLTPKARRVEIALFAEDEISLVRDRLSLIVGAQVGRATNSGNSVQPTVRLLWTPRANLSTWIAASRAVRTASLDERGIDYYQTPQVLPPPAPPLLAIAHLVGNPSERDEDLLSYEAGQRIQVSKKISFDLSTFYSIYHHLGSITTGTPALEFSSGVPYLLIPVTFANDAHGNSYGAEVSASWNPSTRWRLTGGFDLLRVQTYAGADAYRVTNASPNRQWDLRSYFDVTRKIQIDTALYYTGMILNPGIPQHLRGDLRIGWKLTPAADLSIGVRDAFQPTHVEYQSTRYNQLAEVARNFYVRLTWRF